LDYTSGTDVFTILNYYSEIRFRICDVDTLYEYYDSNETTNKDAHRTNFCQSHHHAEKDQITLTAGKDYYLVVYPLSTISSKPLVEDTMNITIGKPNMSRGDVTVFATSTITATSSAFSPAASIVVGDNGKTVPRTAVVWRVDRRNRPGLLLSELPYWRIKYPGGRNWITSAQCDYIIDIGYTEDGTNNKNINGIWQISGKADKHYSPLTYTPGINIAYYYELGD